MNYKNITKISSNHPDDLLVIEYDLGNVCNYQCWYCFPGSNEGTVKWPDVDQAISAVRTIIDFYSKNGKKQFIIDLIGGEVTVWSQLTRFVKGINADNVLVNIITNGSRSVSWWRKHGLLFGRVAISYHPQFASVDHIVKVADMLYRNNVHVEVSVSIDPKNFEESENVLVDLEEKSSCKWAIFRNEILINGKNVYTPEQNTIVSQKVFRYPSLLYFLRTSKLNIKFYWAYTTDSKIPRLVTARNLMMNGARHFLGWSCNLGVDLIYINRNGNLTGSCGNRLYQLDHYINIYDQDFANVFAPALLPARCHTLQCGCDREIEVRKQIAIDITHLHKKHK